MTHHDFHSVRLNKSLLDGYLDAGQHLHLFFRLMISNNVILSHK